MTLDNAPTNEPTESGSGLSRRTVMRGAAISAWAVPAVTLVTAAPAFAVSSLITVSTFTANYLNYDNEGTVDPTKLVVGAKFGNSGTEATQNLQFTLAIPANLYGTAPTALAAPGWTGPSISGSLAAGWSLVFTRITQLSGGATAVAFDTTITFTDPATSWANAPFRRWGGNAFTLEGSATATNAPTVGAAAGVVATPLCQIYTTGRSVAGNGNALSTPRAISKIVDIYNDGRSSIGKITLVLTIFRSSSTVNVFHRKPPGTVQATDSKWTFVGSDVSTGDSGPWKYTFTTKVDGYSPSGGAKGGSDDYDGPIKNNSFYTEILATYKSPDSGTTPGSATFTLTAPHAASTGPQAG